MRKEFVQVETHEEALDLCPWAAVCHKADGGWWCFESETDAETWLAQV
jgi:hypothetical protein